MSLLVVVGAAIIVLLGSVHAVYTFRSQPFRGPMTPTDARVREAMQIPGGLGLAPQIDSTLWKAWIGFNLSHSLGVILIGLVIGIPALSNFEGAIDHRGWVALALLTPAIYLAISIRHWFREPTIGIALAATLITAGLIGGSLTG